MFLEKPKDSEMREMTDEDVKNFLLCTYDKLEKQENLPEKLNKQMKQNPWLYNR